MTTASNSTTVEPPPVTLTIMTTTLTTILPTATPNDTTSTTSRTTITKTTVTKTTTTIHPAHTCSTTKIDSWCANPISNFTTKSVCLKAASLCTTDAQHCVAVAGNKNLEKCVMYLLMHVIV
ncbi:hypothetical protein BGX38DRAFT_752773 [Terfezia claveryi]|nr:hypothetical protein BGX38DRAFT_752773 [Terfezia claveryi]